MSSIKVQLVEVQGDHDWHDLEPGDYYHPKALSLEGRGPIQLVVIIPNGDPFLVDGRWTVTGEGETLTITPSLWSGPGIGKPGEWHGWLRNGELIEC